MMKRLHYSFIGVCCTLLLFGLTLGFALPRMSQDIRFLTIPNIPGNGEDRFCIQDLEFFPDTNTYQVINSTRDCLPGIQFPDFPGLSIAYIGGPEYLEDPYLAAWPFKGLIEESESYMFAYLFDTPSLYRNSILEGDIFFFDKPVEGTPVPGHLETLSKELESGIIRDDLIDNRSFQSERCFLRHHYKIQKEDGIRSLSVIVLNGFLQPEIIQLKTIPETRRVLREEYWQCTFAAFAHANLRGERHQQQHFTIPEDVIAEYYTKPLGHLYDEGSEG